MNIFLKNEEIRVLNNIVNEALNGTCTVPNLTLTKDEKNKLFIKINDFELKNHLSVNFNKKNIIIIKKCIEATLKYLDPEDYETHLGATQSEINTLEYKIFGF
jgi:hypothetical protein